MITSAHPNRRPSSANNPSSAEGLAAVGKCKPRTVTVRQAREITSLGLTKLNELISDGTLRSVKIGKRRLVFLDSIEELLAG